jgi:hypothetical protein
VVSHAKLGHTMIEDEVNAYSREVIDQHYMVISKKNALNGYLHQLNNNK